MQRQLRSGGLPSPFVLLTWPAFTSLCHLLASAMAGPKRPGQLAGHWVHRDLVRDVLKSVCVLAVQHTPRPPPTHSSGTLWRSRHTPDTARGSWPGTRTHTALTLYFLGLNLTCACHANRHMLCMPDHNHWLPM